MSDVCGARQAAWWAIPVLDRNRLLSTRSNPPGDLPSPECIPCPSCGAKALETCDAKGRPLSVVLAESLAGLEANPPRTLVDRADRWAELLEQFACSIVDRAVARVNAERQERTLEGVAKEVVKAAPVLVPIAKGDSFEEVGSPGVTLFVLDVDSDEGFACLSRRPGDWVSFFDLRNPKHYRRCGVKPSAGTCAEQWCSADPCEDMGHRARHDVPRLLRIEAAVRALITTDGGDGGACVRDYEALRVAYGAEPNPARVEPFLGRAPFDAWRAGKKTATSDPVRAVLGCDRADLGPLLLASLAQASGGATGEHVADLATAMHIAADWLSWRA